MRASKLRKIYKITEYSSFFPVKQSDDQQIDKKQIKGLVPLPEHTFNALEAFVLTNRNKETNPLDLLGLSAKKGIGKIITAKNYVGVITMIDGTTIEILPKLFPNETEALVKRLLIDMLKSLRDSPYKSLNLSNVNIERMSIFEVFIRMFVDEVLFIEKRSLKSGYQTIQSNESVFKGKLKVSDHIKYNYAHQERSYVEYDEFNTNRPENRLIKTTLLKLYRMSQSSKNRRDIKKMLNSFSEISESTDINGDFDKYVPDRNMKDYTTALMWCRVFLQNKSFSAFSGSEVAFALLFSMETLFESYIAQKLRLYLNPKDYTISSQDRSYHLFDYPRQFLIKPDIVVSRKKDGAVFVLDTKWKLLSPAKANYGISQADMYQMYAYQKKYQSENVTLIYPATDTLSKEKKIQFLSKDGVAVLVRFVVLFNLKESLSSIMKNFEKTEGTGNV